MSRNRLNSVSSLNSVLGSALAGTEFELEITLQSDSDHDDGGGGGVYLDLAAGSGSSNDINAHLPASLKNSIMGAIAEVSLMLRSGGGGCYGGKRGSSTLEHTGFMEC